MVSYTTFRCEQNIPAVTWNRQEIWAAVQSLSGETGGCRSENPYKRRHRVTSNLLISIPILVSKLLGQVESLSSLSRSFSCCWAIFVTWQGAVTTGGLMSLEYVHAVGGEGDVVKLQWRFGKWFAKRCTEKDFWEDYISVVRLSVVLTRSHGVLVFC